MNQLERLLGIKEDELERLRRWYKSDETEIARAGRQKDGQALKAQIAEIKRYMEQGGELGIPKCAKNIAQKHFCFLRLRSDSKVSCPYLPGKCGFSLEDK